jgi:hypothetical protein
MKGHAVRKLKFALIPAIAALVAISFAVPATAATQNVAPLAASVAASHSAHATEYRVVTKYGTLTYGTRPLTDGVRGSSKLAGNLLSLDYWLFCGAGCCG